LRRVEKFHHDRSFLREEGGEKRALKIFVNIGVVEEEGGKQMSHLFVSALLIFNRNTCKSGEGGDGILY
jgi:hypothetical protein